VIVAGNWKMFAGPDPQLLSARVGGIEGVDVIVAPPYTTLAAVVQAGLTTYAQNVHWEAEGAYTGEISAPMLAALGVAGAIVGHSERRQYFGETDSTVARRAHAALEAGLGVIACVGETDAQRDAGATFAVVDQHLGGALTHVTAAQADRVVIAYEPVWAIGTGRTATPAQAQEVHAHIRAHLRAKLGNAAGDAIRIQYGGSVKPANAEALMSQPDIDGALVGGASLEAADFVGIVKAARPR